MQVLGCSRPPALTTTALNLSFHEFSKCDPPRHWFLEWNDRWYHGEPFTISEDGWKTRWVRLASISSRNEDRVWIWKVHKRDKHKPDTLAQLRSKLEQFRLVLVVEWWCKVDILGGSQGNWHWGFNLWKSRQVGSRVRNLEAVRANQF